MDQWYAYMLLCDQKMFYIGITNNILQRMREHKGKKSFFTKKFSDLKLVYAEKYTTKSAAARREKQVKRWSYAKKQLLVDGTLGINSCTGLVEALLAADENLVSLLRV